MPQPAPERRRHVFISYSRADRAWVDRLRITMAPLLREAGEDAGRLLRGGSWYGYPRFCRSAYRIHLRPDNVFDFVGFRVVCLPQGPSLNS